MAAGQAGGAGVTVDLNMNGGMKAAVAPHLPHWCKSPPCLSVTPPTPGQTLMTGAVLFSGN